MKKLSFIDVLIYLCNTLAAVLLLASYAIPYISPKSIATVSVLSLGLPPLLFINAGFALYWLVKLKKQFLISTLVIALGYQHVQAFFQFSEKKIMRNDDYKIMSYNVRLFNIFHWTDKDSLQYKIHQFIDTKAPDVLCIQEYHRKTKKIKDYQYQYIKHNNASIGQAILSKHKIINQGSLDFEKTGNNAVFADIVFKKDTLRIYNIHMQSLKMQIEKDNFGSKDTESLISKLKKHFKTQATQVEQILAHQEKSPYRTMIVGDFNNTAFSWVYKQLRSNKKDAFIEAGANFGKSFNYIIPVRIDFILTDPSIEINNFKTYSVEYSDHYPIMARFNFSNPPI